MPRRNKFQALAGHSTPLRPATSDLKLFADPTIAQHTVTAYGPDHVAVNSRPFRHSLLLLPDDLDESWGPATFLALDADHLAPLVHLGCDVLLLGTGARQRFPAPELLRPFYAAGRPVEIMDTPAACRTFNILVAEGRHVAAALIVESSSPS